MHFHLICKRNSKYLLVVNRVKGFPTATARTASVLSLMDPSVSSRRSFSRQTRPPEQFVDFSTDSPQQPQAKKKKKEQSEWKGSVGFYLHGNIDWYSKGWAAAKCSDHCRVRTGEGEWCKTKEGMWTQTWKGANVTGCLLPLDPSTHAWTAWKASGLKLLCGAAGQDQTSCQRGHHLNAIVLFIPSSLKLSRRFCSAVIFASIFNTGGSGGGFWRNVAQPEWPHAAPPPFSALFGNRLLCIREHDSRTCLLKGGHMLCILLNLLGLHLCMLPLRSSWMFNNPESPRPIMTGKSDN